MDLRLVTSPQQRNAFATPRTASFQTPAQATAMSPKASTAPVRPTATSFFGTPRDANISNVGTDEDLSRIDPDELFIRYTVAQVKSLASNLRAEAEAKQEELRLMVGERYRDLLQASTSIIDMASSSQSVVDALQDMKEVCSEQGVSREPMHIRSNAEAEDAQLKALQSLAAHMKLLLDCPEHFWKLLERKQYLDAGWLFLVAKVVYHSLMDEEDGEGWSDQGIVVLEQFPLVQRQWDAINGFRGQISHKATLSMREEMTFQETLHAVASLFLLDNMALNDTLTVLLSQRSKSVHTFLSSPTTPTRIREDDHREGSIKPSKRIRKRNLRNVEQNLSQAIELLIGTMHTTRLIYGSESGKPSAIESLLLDSQSDNQNAAISTQKVLGALPSASLLDLYLPPTVKTYIHYIDATSPSFEFSASNLSSKLEQWFSKGLNALNVKLEDWVSTLTSAADVDEVRAAALSASLLERLSKKEQELLTHSVNQACSRRIAKIWKEAFVSLRQEFEASLSKALELIRTSDPAAVADINPTNTLLSSNLPFPPSSRTNQSQTTIDLAFSKFTGTLSQRRTNRTPLLDAIVSSVETQTKQLQEELEVISGGKSSSKVALIAQFEPFEDQICNEFVAVLQRELDAVSSVNDEASMNVAIFVGRVAAALSSSNSFVDSLLASGKAVHEFKEAAGKIHSQTISAWQSRSVQKAVKSVEGAFITSSEENLPAEDLSPSDRPSSVLLEALIALISDTHRLGLSRPTLDSRRIFSTSLDGFTVGCLDLVKIDSLRPNTFTSQLLWDALFLEALCQEMEVTGTNKGAIAKLQEQVISLMGAKSAQKFLTSTRESVTRSLPRFQLLLSPLIKHRTSAESLSQRSASKAEAATIELAQPSPRFGLLLVPGSTRTTTR